ncbi:uncharacterized protein [Palaemon carinicauda]|uniref:uncharacterized protein n=1 Tax=Palaemon carinicauda TaxID=392227 RepID=UPI0035B6165A
MARRGGLSQEQILSALNDIPEDVSEYEDDYLDSYDNYLHNESESSSSDSDVEEKEMYFSEPNARSTLHFIINEETEESILEDIVASDGTEWKRILADKCSGGRRSEQNILQRCLDLQAMQKRCITVGTPSKCMSTND